MKITELIKEASTRLEQQDLEGSLGLIYDGLAIEPGNYELYFMLGQIKELQGKLIQAKLSYENAVFLSNEEDYSCLWENYRAFMEGHQMENRGVSIILVTYNQLEYTQICIESIRYNVADFNREIIVVDNLSTDGTREWLVQQKDIRLILNEENRGLPAACNQGAALAEDGNDIFLLNNDTILPKNSVYNLRMALYEHENVGMTGACSNFVGNHQKVEKNFETAEEYLDWVDGYNALSPLKHHRRLKLIGFALMIRREAWENTGGMDERFGLGNFEDDDLSINMLVHDYLLIFCKDAFIFHFGHQSFGKMKKEKNREYRKLFVTNSNKLEGKWGLNWKYYTHVRYPLLEYFDRSPQDSFSVLDIGCGAGATMVEISNCFPKADLYGIELNKTVADIASHYLNVVQGNIEELQNPFGRTYDYILLGDVLEHLREPEKILLALKDWLKEEGCFIISLPNVMHISVLYELLHGNFTYQDEGILDRTHLRFFTKKEIVAMIQRCGLLLECMGGLILSMEGTSREKNMLRYIERLYQMDASIPKEEMNIYQYRLRARKK